MSRRKADQLREDISAVEAWMAAPAFETWTRSRYAEIDQFNTQIAETAKSWDEVLLLRGQRDNTIELLSTFESLRDQLKEALDACVEEETQNAATSKL